MFTAKAEERILQGFQTWESAEKEQNLTQYRAAVGLFKSGLKEITEPVPELYGKFAWLTYNAGILAFQQHASDANLLLRSAEIHANTALRDEPENFDSHLTLVCLAGDRITNKVTFEDVVTPATGVGGIIGKVFGLSVAASQASATRAHFSARVMNLVQAFKQTTHKDPDCQDFLFRCHRLGGIAEFCRELGLHKEEKAVYRAIVDVKSATLSYDSLDSSEVPDYQKAVAEVSALAEAFLDGIY